MCFKSCDLSQLYDEVFLPAKRIPAPSTETVVVQILDNITLQASKQAELAVIGTAVALQQTVLHTTLAPFWCAAQICWALALPDKFAHHCLPPTLAKTLSSTCESLREF